jgi:hypothetical protein
MLPSLPGRSHHSRTPPLSMFNPLDLDWRGRGERAAGGRGRCVGGLEEDLEGAEEELD